MSKRSSFLNSFSLLDVFIVVLSSSQRPVLHQFEIGECRCTSCTTDWLHGLIITQKWVHMKARTHTDRNLNLLTDLDLTYPTYDDADQASYCDFQFSLLAAWLISIPIRFLWKKHPPPVDDAARLLNFLSRLWTEMDPLEHSELPGADFFCWYIFDASLLSILLNIKAADHQDLTTLSILSGPAYYCVWWLIFGSLLVTSRSSGVNDPRWADDSNTFAPHK